MKLLIVDDEKLTVKDILKNVLPLENWGFTTLLWQMTASTALRSP